MTDDGHPGAHDPGELREIGRLRIHVVDEGTGPPLLLMAALGSNWFDLDPLAQRLVERGYRVIRYDRPGYGISDEVPLDGVPTLAGEVNRMVAVLDAVGVSGRVTVVGHSIASLYAEAFARREPDRTAAVVMLDGSYVLVPWRLVPAWFRVANAHRSVRLARGMLGRLGVRRRGGNRIRSALFPAPPEGFDARQRYWARRLFGGYPMLLATLVENAAFPTSNEDLRALRRTTPMPAVRSVVVAALSGPRLWQRFWRWKQGRFAAVLGGRMVTVVARHFLVLEIPDEVAAIIDEAAPDRR